MSLAPCHQVRAVVLLSNGLDLPYSMHIIQVTFSYRTIKNLKNTNKKFKLMITYCCTQALAAKQQGNIAIGGAVGEP